MSAASGSLDDSKIGARRPRLGQVWKGANVQAAAQMPKQLSGSTSHSDISVESTNSVDYGSLSALGDRLVDADLSAASPSHRRSRSALFRSCLVGVVLAGGTSAVIAFWQFSLADIWRDHVSSWAQLHRPTLTMHAERVIPWLMVQSSRGHVGEPIPLGLAIHGPAEGAVIIITGLLPGMELSKGIEIDLGRWEVLEKDVNDAWIAPPDGFVGSAAPTAELRLTDNSISFRQVMHLEWVPSTATVLAGEHDLEKAAPIPVSPSLAPEPGDRQQVTVSPNSPVLAGEGDLKKVAIPILPSLAPEQGDRQQVTVSPSSPVLTGEGDVAKAAAIPVSPSLAPEGDLQEVTVSSSPLVLAGERDQERAAAIPNSPSLAQGQVGRVDAVVRSMFPSIAEKQIDRQQPMAGSSLPTFAQRQLDREEVTVLLKRGKDLIANGDIAAARLILKRAADANNAEAALALAATFDPFVLRELKVYGFPPDAVLARVWYEKATELGSPTALRRLEILTQGEGTP